jgi:chorismate mutase
MCRHFSRDRYVAKVIISILSRAPETHCGSSSYELNYGNYVQYIRCIHSFLKMSQSLTSALFPDSSSTSISGLLKKIQRPTNNQGQNVRFHANDHNMLPLCSGNNGVLAMARFLVFAVAIFLPSCTVAFAQWGPERRSTRVSMSTHSGSTKAEEKIKTVDVLSLESIRSTLIRQEETIIFALIERAQFRQNPIAYEKGGFAGLGTPVGVTPVESDEELSFLEYMLIGTEALHCRSRRYTSPEEHPFFPDRLPEGPIGALPKLQFPKLLSSEGGASELNFNHVLLKKYVDTIVPSLSKRGDDEQHGSSVLCDIAVLQSLSRRVHYGKFVAESKYRSDPEGYQRLVEAGDTDGVMRLLTDDVVEAKVLRRSRLKAATYGQEPLLVDLPRIDGGETSSIVAAAAASAVVAALEAIENDQVQPGKVDPAVIESVYRDIIIPLTKVIEVAYLFRRCGREPPADYMP